MKITYQIILLTNILLSATCVISQEEHADYCNSEGNYYSELSEKYVEVNYDSAMLYTLLSADCYFDAENHEMYLRSILGTINIELLYKDYLFFEEKYEWFYRELLSIYPTNRNLEAILLNTNVYYQKISGNYNEAIDLAMKAIDIIEAEPNSNYALAVYHNNLATLYFIKNDFQRCMNESNLALMFYNKSLSKVNSNLVPAIYFNIARNCVKVNDIICAKNYFDKSFGLMEELKMPKQMLEMQNDYISICIENKFCELAATNFEKIDDNFLLNNLDSLNFYLNEIGVNNCLGISSNKELFDRCWNLISNQEIEFQKELYTIQLLNLKINSLHFESKFNSEAVDKINIKVSKYLKNEKWNIVLKLDFLINKAKYQLRDLNYNSESDLGLIAKYMILSLKDLKSIESKLIQKQKSYSVQNYFLTELKFRDNFFQQYFEILEMNKSTILFDQIYENETQSDFVSEDLLLKEEKARRFLLFLEKELATSNGNFDSSKNSTDSLKLNNLKLQISKASNEYDIIKHEIAEKYPEYNDYVLEDSYFETSEIQSSLKPNELLLETVFTDDFCLLVFFSNTEVHTVKIENENYTKLLANLDLISSGSFQKGDQMENLSEISRLLQLEGIAILDNKSRLIIVPDGPLYNLPFELLSRNGKRLLEDFSISYQYSYKLLMVLKKHRENSNEKKTFLGVSFPTNEAIASSERVCDELELSKLSCAKNEIQNIENILHINNTKSDLTTDEFINASKDARIIHIASHACPDEENHQLSRIHFKDDFLTNYDISAMSLNADLAVLSACETGFGKVIEGEGAMTIARAFFQAGVNTNIVSLWKVDDCSTAELMNYFYQRLYAGEDSDVALQNAKLDFLEKSHPQYHDPYYWAGFIHMGDTAPIFPKSNNTKYLLFAFIGVVAIGFGFKGYREMKGRAA